MLPYFAHITDYILRLIRVKHLPFLDSRSTQCLNAIRYRKQHSKFMKKNMGVIMRNVCLLPTGGVWDSSVEVALNNSATFLHSLWHKPSFSWEIASSGKLSMQWDTKYLLLFRELCWLVWQNCYITEVSWEQKGILTELEWGKTI